MIGYLIARPIERKFFPGYVLVKMELTDDAYHLVKNTPKVTGFLGAQGGAKPLPVSEREVQNIIGAVEEGVERPKPTIRFDIGETVKVIANPVRLSATPPAYKSAPPALGQHTAEVLGGLLGMGEAEITGLREKGVT